MADQFAERRRDAVNFAKHEHRDGGPIWRGLCQKFTRTGCGAGPGAGSAIIAWRTLPRADRHSGPRPPAGVPVYWSIGVYGHAAISAGKGYVWSTDILRRGHVDKVSIAYLSRRWGADYLGWAETINGRRVWPEHKDIA